MENRGYSIYEIGILGGNDKGEIKFILFLMFYVIVIFGSDNMIDEMLRYVKKSDLDKGLNYDNRKVRYIGSSVDFGDFKHRFIVSSEHTLKSYIVTVEVNSNREIIDTFCTCPQFNLTSSCKHLAAVLIKFQGEYFLFDEEEHSNIIVTSLLNELKRTSMDKNIIKKEARVVPYLKLEKSYSYYSYYDTEDYELKFKVGDTKLYMLGNKVGTFIDRYHNGGEIKFGKEFIFSNKNFYFNNESKRLINFIELAYSRLYRYDSFLLPTKINLDELFSIVDSIYVDSPGINKELAVVKQLPFNFKVIKEKDNHILKIDYDLTKLRKLSDDYSYLIDKNAIYRLNKKETILAKNILEEEIDTLTFSDGYFKEFKDYVVPNIKDRLELDETVDDLIIINTPDVKLYFDILEAYIECKIIFIYGDIEVNYLDKVNNNIVRDRDFEKSVFLDVVNYGFDDNLRLYDIDEVGDFLENGIDELNKNYNIFTSEKLKNTSLIKKVNGSTTFSIGSDNILNYEFKLDNISPSELDSIFLSLKSKKKYYKLKNGDILDLLDPSIKELEELKEDLDLDCESGVLPKFRALYLDSLKNKNRFIRTNSLFDFFVQKFKEYKDATVLFTENENKLLRSYQKDGVKWLYNLYKCSLGGILADEMGLGKSLQTIIFIRRILEEDSDAKILIVTPTALVYNWDNEFKKFSDDIKRCIFVGLKKERHRKLDEYDGNVYITSYGLLREDLDIYKEMNFKVMIIDEAQNIKNPMAMLTKAVKSINSEVKIALTGTPIENSILELWSIFDYVMPGFFASKNKFSEKYKIGEDFDDDTNITLSKLRSQFKPFILRRKKNEVLKDLPDKLENNIYIDLSDEEKKIYAALVKETKEEMEELVNAGFSKNKMQILTLLTRLRQVCIDPKIVFDNFNKTSSKIEHLIDVIKESVSNGHKLLLFTSFKTALNIVKDSITKEGITSYVIDGSVSSKKRQELVDKFNNDDTNIFLIMLKSGGTGLNLTSADVVIHLDLWWNPQAENQATDRAHRIGQKNTVEVIKLISKGTIEEKILDLQVKKKILSDKLIENDGDEYKSFQNLSVNDIRELLKYNNE